MEQKIKLQTENLLHDLWRLTPARMAEHLTQGRFQRFRHIQYIDRKIAEAVAKGGARLVLSMPPRHGKSWLASLYTPAWFLSLWPNRQIILTSYEATFASSWGRAVRNFVQEHESKLGIRLSEDSLASDRWSTSKGGGMVTAGIGGPITGRGGHLIIVDDPIKNSEEASSEVIRAKQIEWFNSTLYTRAEPGASIIVLMTRWHQDDLAGYLLNSHQDPWQEIRLPALAEAEDPLDRLVGDALCPERYSTEMLSQIQAAVGPLVWASLYQQRPVPAEGNLFKTEMFEFCDVPEKFDYTFIQADTAYKDKQENDFTVFAAFGVKNKELYVIDILRERLKSSDIEAPAVAFIKKYSVAYGFRGAYIEPKGHGIYLNQILPRRGLFLPSESTLKEFYSDRHLNKVERANNAIPHLVGRKVKINQQISIREELVGECLSFPKAKHDDFVDTLVDAVKLSFSTSVSIFDVL